MSRLFSTLPLILTLGILSVFTSATAHEYWIQPHDYRLEPNQPLIADVRVGQEFVGDVQAFIPSAFTSFNITDASGSRGLTGRIGDIPAVNFATEEPGLQVLNLFTTTSQLTWQEFDKFEEFVNLHGIAWVLEAHSERGLPETGFKEAYTRFVKTLVAVGDGAGEDHFTGMFFELVAGANPYTDDVSAGMPVTVLFKGQPLPDMQVDLFFRDSAGALTRLSVVSNTTGQALVPNLGAGEYMVNVVHMIIPFEADTARTGMVWHSLWGSLTYAIGS